MVHETVLDAGPIPGIATMTDDDYTTAINSVLKQIPACGPWVFAYGSLLWDPVYQSVESRSAIVHGWHRAFCFWVKRGRGTLDRPGLMMALDRGGQCQGMVFRLSQETLTESLGKLFRREIMTKPWINLPKWLRVRTAQGALTALTFVVNRSEPRYAGRLHLDTVADVLSVAVGHRGSGAEYLLNTISHLDQRGIRDGYLWRLQNLVARRIRAKHASGCVPRRRNRTPASPLGSLLGCLRASACASAPRVG
jgi:cation transport protein ChaC